MFARAGVSISQKMLFLVLAFLFGGSALAAEQPKKAASGSHRPSTKPEATPPSQSMATFTLTPGFSVKPSDVTVPADVPVGQYRRVVRPFPNWTLICDENLQKKQKVCNILQAIVGPDGSTVFSWSLAASQDGQPFFILRTPAMVGEGKPIQLDISDGGPALTVPVKGCTAQVCLAYLPVVPRLREAVEKGGSVQVSYRNGTPPDDVSFRVPLMGLAAALAGI